MARLDTWESYFYPPPDNTTLRNIVDIRDPDELHSFESSAAAFRQHKLNTVPTIVVHSYDAEHVCAIHRYLFQDVYEWAGEFRTMNMHKNGAIREFADVNTSEIDRYLAEVKHLVTGTARNRLDRSQFIIAAADVFAHLFQAHPFREGNGRSSKVFMEQVSQRSRFTFDFARVSPEEWNQASEFSRPDIGKYDVVPDELVPVFRLIVVERSTD